MFTNTDRVARCPSHWLVVCDYRLLTGTCALLRVVRQPHMAATMRAASSRGCALLPALCAALALATAAFLPAGVEGRPTFTPYNGHAGLIIPTPPSGKGHVAVSACARLQTRAQLLLRGVL